MTSLRRRLPRAIVLTLPILAIGLGCESRKLDPNQMSGAGGVGTFTGAGGAIGDGGTSVDGLGLEPLVLKPCGNGHLDSGEQCDDGNTTAGDGCSALCQFE